MWPCLLVPTVDFFEIILVNTTIILIIESCTTKMNFRMKLNERGGRLRNNAIYYEGVRKRGAEY